MAGAGPAAMMGGNGAQNSGPLLAALKTLAPANNPKTPNERINPQQTALEHLKSASISLERSKESMDDPMLHKAVDAMIGGINKALLQFDGQSVLSALQQSLGPPPGAPMLGGPPGAPGAAPPPGAAAFGSPPGPQGLGAPAAPPPQVPPGTGGA